MAKLPLLPDGKKQRVLKSSVCYFKQYPEQLMLKIELNGDGSAKTTTPIKFMIKRIKAKKELPRLASIHRMGAEWYIKHTKETDVSCQGRDLEGKKRTSLPTLFF